VAIQTTGSENIPIAHQSTGTLFGAGPECLSTFLNFRNNDEWLEVLTLIEVYNKVQGHYVERNPSNIGIMELIAGKSEFNTFIVLSKDRYEQQVIKKKNP
jgi:hypothetical protein